MKKILTFTFILLISFSTKIFADETEFQIEGMSLGDSLLDYYSEKEIKKAKAKVEKSWSYKDKTYTPLSFHKKLKTYNSVQVNYKTQDDDFTIESVSGSRTYKKNIEDCYKKQDEIVDELTGFFEDAEKLGYGTYEHFYDKSGETTIKGVSFIFKSGAEVLIQCTDWSKKFTRKKKWHDELRISIDTKEFLDFLDYAY